MKRLAFLFVGSAILLVMGAVPALADNGPHTPSTGNTTVDRCAGCHRAHTSTQAYLLQDTQPALCYTCHGADAGGATTDVVDGIGYTDANHTSQAGALRGGGFAYALIDSSHATRSPTKTVPVLTAGAATTSSHTVDGTAGVAWGGGAIGSGAGTAISLRCGSCHDPHGNGNYRILRPVPNDSGAATGVTIADATTKSYTTTNYWATNDVYSPTTTVDYTNSSGVTTTYTTTDFIKNISAWCTTCHTRYLAGSGSYKTSSGDPIYTYRHRSDQNYKEGGANCITCHVAHGTNASMAGDGKTSYSSTVANPDGSGPLGSSKLLRVDNRGTCNMCHNK